MKSVLFFDLSTNVKKKAKRKYEPYYMSGGDGGGRKGNTVASGFGYRPIARNGTCVAETECHYFKLGPFAKTPGESSIISD